MGVTLEKYGVISLCLACKTEHKSLHVLCVTQPPGWLFFDKQIVSQDKMDGSEGGGGGRASPFCAGATQKEGIAG